MAKQLFRRPTNFVQRSKIEKKWRIKQIHRRPLLFVQHYLDELSYYLTEKMIFRLKIFGQFLGIVLLTALLAFIFLGNSAPFGITAQYALGQDSKSISPIGPRNRVESITYNGQQATKLTDDLAYFTTTMPFQFDTATVKVYYENPNSDQTFSLGFHDQQEWHYDTKPIDVPFINNLNWNRTGTDPVLYQRIKTFNSVDDFIANAPLNDVIGTYAYNSGFGDVSQTQLTSYKPTTQPTVINTALRGKHIIYAYLDHEPFHMKIYKQDLNWYDGADPMTISIYKDNDLVMQQTADDDGITDSSHKALHPQEIDISNPGPGLPESGVYKIVIDAGSDTLIRRIETNLHKIVFQGSLFLAGNSEVYGPAIASTSASTVYTNALSLSAITYHGSGEQVIQVGNQPFNLDMMQIPLIITPQDTISKIIVPKNDLVLNAFQGYFAFSPDQFFLPTKYHILPISKSDDISLVDYILTEYTPPHQEAGWQVNQQTFDLSTAFIQNNKLNWVIQAPHLKENGHSIIIKDIQVTFNKKGWNG